MKMLTKAIRKAMPELYANEPDDSTTVDPQVICKFFTPWAGWTWYALEASAVVRDEVDGAEYGPVADHEGKDVVFWGWVCGHEEELGYFRLSELEGIRGPAGLRIERDMYFVSRPLSEVQERHHRMGAA